MRKKKLKNGSSTRMRHRKNEYCEEGDDRKLCCSSYLCDYLTPKDTWFVKDKCGIICVFLTWFLVIFGEIVVTFVILPPFKLTVYSVINGTIFNALAFLALASHASTIFTDPVN